MNINKFIVIFLSIGCSLFSCQKKHQTEQQPRPNVVFIAVDDLNNWVGKMKRHPQVKTPNLDRLIDQGVLFNNAHTASPVCQASRIALLSGLKPTTTGWYCNIWDKDLKETVYDSIHHMNQFLPEYFKANGYSTYGAGKLFHSGVMEFEKDAPQLWTDHTPAYEITDQEMLKSGNHYGGDMFYPFPKDGGQLYQKYGKIKGLSLCGGPVKREEMKDGVMHDEWVADWAIEKLNINHDEPFFLGVGFARPHVPYTAPKEYFDLYTEDDFYIPSVEEGEMKNIPLYGKAISMGLIPGGDHEKVMGVGEDFPKELVRSYLACISFVDAQIGKVLKALEESPYADNTIVVVWSDHGQHLGEKNSWRKMTLWEPSTNVPLIFKLPSAVSKGKITNDAVSLLDVYPTLLDLCQLPQNDRLEGQSLMSILNNPEVAHDRNVLTTWMYNNHSVRSKDWRYIKYRDGGEELYNIQSDPLEKKNLIAVEKYKAIKETLQKDLPSKMANPFLMENVYEDELDNYVKKWEKEGIPDWLN